MFMLKVVPIQPSSTIRRLIGMLPSPKAKIEHITSHVPERILANHELALLFGDWTAEKIHEKTGIEERRIAGPEETASDLAFAAAEKLLSTHAIDRNSIDFLL